MLSMTSALTCNDMFYCVVQSVNIKIIIILFLKACIRNKVQELLTQNIKFHALKITIYAVKS